MSNSRPYTSPLHLPSPLDAFDQALEHEKEITSRIHRLYDLAVQESDYPAQILLNWFATEQVEEEKSVTEIVERLRMAGEDSAALLAPTSVPRNTRRDIYRLFTNCREEPFFSEVRT